jgi:hypothetical protein
MSIRTQLASLRPQMPFRHLLKVIQSDTEPTPGQWVSSFQQFSAKANEHGLLETLIFEEKFPGTIPIERLHIGMKLDEVLVQLKDCRLAPKRLLPFNKTDYISTTSEGHFLMARVGPYGLVRELQISQHDWPPEDRTNRILTKELQFHIDPFSANDYNEMLTEWAATYTFTTLKAESLFPAYVHWLIHQATPDDWHLAVLDWNWDYGIEPLLWIIRQKECDKATALTTFYLSRPGILKTADLYDEDKLAAEIRQRWLNGFYTRSTLAFDGPKAFKEDTDLPRNADPEAVKLSIPKSMRVVVPGRTLPEIRGYPWSLFQVDKPTPSKQIPPPLTPDEQAEIERIKIAAAARKSR